MVNAQEVIANDHDYFLQVYSRPDFVLERGEGCYLFDSEGQRYLDFVAGIAVNALGYKDPDVTAAIHEYADGLLHVSGLYHNTASASLARKLVESTDWAGKVFLTNSGAEAIEGALKFSRRYAGEHYGSHKHIVVSFSGSFHGRTMGAVAITAREKYRAPFEPVMPGVRFAEFNDPAALELVDDDVCAVVIEPIQGEGGLSVASNAFLQSLRQRCDAVGALLVFDEIQCGMGRTGTLWAYQQTGVEPDIMTVAKPLGGGLPIGAVLMHQKVADAMHVGDHGSTFAGGPFISAVAERVFRKISDPSFLEHVREISDYLDESLNELASSNPRILELRGRGLMRGIRIDGAAADVRKAAQDKGLLVATAGDDVVRMVPPLILGHEQVDEAMQVLGEAIKVLGS